MAKVRYLSVEKGKKLGIEDFPSFSATGSIKGMKKQFYGKDALLVRCGSWIYNVTSKPSIYDAANESLSKAGNVLGLLEDKYGDDAKYREDLVAKLKEIGPLRVSSGAIVDKNDNTILKANRETGTTPLAPVQRDELIKLVLQLVNNFLK